MPQPSAGPLVPKAAKLGGRQFILQPLQGSLDLGHAKADRARRGVTEATDGSGRLPPIQSCDAVNHQPKPNRTRNRNRKPRPRPGPLLPGQDPEIGAWGLRDVASDGVRHKFLPVGTVTQPAAGV